MGIFARPAYPTVSIAAQDSPTMRRFALRLSRVAALVRKLIGVPDYDTYLAHMSSRYPGCTPIDRATFEKDRLAARYRTAGTRCC